MTSVRKSLIAIVAAGAVLVTPFTANAAMPRGAAPPVAETPLVVEKAGHRKWRKHHRKWRKHRRHRHRGHHAGAFIGGLIIGGAIAHAARPRVYYESPRVYYHPRPAYRLGRAHVNWCYSRYRSYRAYDNTFQPYHGPRRACVSPYY